MKLHIKTQRDTDPILMAMAKEAGVGASDMVEIAIYNLIACWMKDRGFETIEQALSVPVSSMASSGKRPVIAA